MGKGRHGQNLTTSAICYDSDRVCWQFKAYHRSDNTRSSSQPPILSYALVWYLLLHQQDNLDTASKLLQIRFAGNLRVVGCQPPRVFIIISLHPKSVNEISD